MAKASFIRRLIRWSLRFLLGLLGMIALYFLAAWIGSKIHLNELPSGDIPIQLVSNGVHVDVVFPLDHPESTWRTFFGDPDWMKPSTRYVAIGWGERSFYLNTPNWSDLTVGTALHATLWPSPTAFHLTPLRGKLRSSPQVRTLMVSAEQHRQLVEAFQQAFSQPEQAIPDASYTGKDRFYEAHGAYHLFMTCNEWINQRMKDADLPAVGWAPFDWGLMARFPED
ncbi:MAG: DUF2459 domain-containing protein [Bacteroidota bacterium]